MAVTHLYLVLAMALGLFGAWLFLSAALHKLTDFPRFSATLSAYQLVHQSFTGTLAGLVVVLELLVAVVLLLVFLAPLLWPVVATYLDQFGALPWLSLAFLAPVLLLGYATAMAVNLFRGRRSIDCGCGGAPMPLSKALVVRNLLMAVGLTWAVLIMSNSNDWSGGGASLAASLLVVLSSSVVLCFVYLIVNQLLANRALHEQLWVQH